MSFCWRKLRHPVSAPLSWASRKLAGLVNSQLEARKSGDLPRIFHRFPPPIERKQENGFCDCPRSPVLIHMMVAREWLLKPGTDIFRQAGREFVR